MKPFERSCLYHASLPMRVIEETDEAEYKRLLATGEWFDHPNKVNKEDIKHEKPIRQYARKGSRNSKQPSETIGDGT